MGGLRSSTHQNSPCGAEILVKPIDERICVARLAPLGGAFVRSSLGLSARKRCSSPSPIEGPRRMKHVFVFIGGCIPLPLGNKPGCASESLMTFIVFAVRPGSLSGSGEDRRPWRGSLTAIGVTADPRVFSSRRDCLFSLLRGSEVTVVCCMVKVLL